MATPAASQIGSVVRVFDPVAYAASLLVIVHSCVLAASVPACARRGSISCDAHKGLSPRHHGADPGPTYAAMTMEQAAYVRGNGFVPRLCAEPTRRIRGSINSTWFDNRET